MVNPCVSSKYLTEFIQCKRTFSIWRVLFSFDQIRLVLYAIQFIIGDFLHEAPNIVG